MNKPKEKVNILCVLSQFYPRIKLRGYFCALYF